MKKRAQVLPTIVFFFKGNGIVFTSVCLREHPEESVLQVLHYISLPGTLRFLTEHFQRSRRKVRRYSDKLRRFPSTFEDDQSSKIVNAKLRITIVCLKYNLLGICFVLQLVH